MPMHTVLAAHVGRERSEHHHTGWYNSMHTVVTHHDDDDADHWERLVLQEGKRYKRLINYSLFAAVVTALRVYTLTEKTPQSAKDVAAWIVQQLMLDPQAIPQAIAAHFFARAKSDRPIHVHWPAGDAIQNRHTEHALPLEFPSLNTLAQQSPPQSPGDVITSPWKRWETSILDYNLMPQNNTLHYDNPLLVATEQHARLR